jgi:hypothetical protein
MPITNRGKILTTSCLNIISYSVRLLLNFLNILRIVHINFVKHSLRELYAAVTNILLPFTKITLIKSRNKSQNYCVQYYKTFRTLRLGS